MSRRTPTDPVVEEIRAIRRRLLRRGGGTVEGYLKVMQELSDRRLAPPRRGVGKTRRKSA